MPSVKGVLLRCAIDRGENCANGCGEDTLYIVLFKNPNPTTTFTKMGPWESSTTEFQYSSDAVYVAQWLEHLPCQTDGIVKPLKSGNSEV